ncbi:MAG TPA: hypothetical protein VF676_12075 [Flavobacterium sp.]|jgi:hypothetical protein
MKEFIRNINLRELLFPVLADMKNINEETDTARVSSNNWDLANNTEDYNEVFEKIQESRSSEDTKHSIIIL